MNQFIDKTIEEIEPQLIQSPRYRYAINKLHHRNTNGEYITKLRIWLIQGLQDRVMLGENLEARILDEESDFTPDQYQCMLSEVFHEVNPGCIPGIPNTRNRSGQQILNWLQGHTIAIRLADWYLYEYLKYTVS